jgi:putative radical SAM enzyme (TIGR03279 family)
MLKVMDIIPGSPASKSGLKIGDGLISFNDQPINDSIDYKYHQAAALIVAKFTHEGRIVIKKMHKSIDGDLGIIFSEENIIRCRNNCVFCFVNNNPQGLRRTLYIKDDDYRQSFLYGNFVTLTNVSKKEIERIIDLRLSPLYISVQATNEYARRALFGREKLPPIMPILEKLARNGIYFHSQIVIVPGFNDGAILSQTAADLARFRPYAVSMAVVPVGLTRYSRAKTSMGAKIQGVNSSKARALVNQVEDFRKLYANKENRFAYSSDEMFIIAGSEIPEPKYYDDFPQIENGVGLVRQFLESVPRRVAAKKRLALSKNGVWITGQSMLPIWQKYVFRRCGFSVNLLPVTNRLYGPKVTVTGLLAGRDIIDSVKRSKIKYGPIILPPNCLNNDDKFIDDLTPAEMAQELGMEIIQGTYDLGETIRLLG